MSALNDRTNSPQSRNQVVSVLELFSRSAGIGFDRSLALRVLAESEWAIEGDDPDTWALRLVEVGESLELRIRSIECPFDDMISFVQQGTPVARCGKNSNGEETWFVLTEIKGRKAKMVDLGSQKREQWISLRKLRKAQWLGGDGERPRWVIGQVALGCQSEGKAPHSESAHAHLKPLTRLIQFIRPEKRDLWMILIFSFVVGVLALASPVAVEALVNTVAFGRYLQPVLVLALVLFFFLAFAAAIRAFTVFVVEILQRRIFIRVVEDLAFRLPRVQRREFDTEYGPELVNRFFDVVTVQKAAASLLLDGIALVLQTIVGMVVLAFYHPFLLGFDVALLLLMVFVILALGRGAVRTAIKESKAKYAMAAWLEELARHQTAWKMNAGSQLAADRADQLAVNWLGARQAHFRIYIRQVVFALGLQAVAATTLLGLGGWLVIVGQLTLGQLVAAELIVMIIVGGFAKLGKHLESYYDVLASIDKLGYLFDLNTESHEHLFHLRQGEPASLRLNDVDFSFGNRKVIGKLCCEFAPGEKIALVGGSGTGKSTLLELLCKLRSPSSGHIEIDNIDIRELRPDSLRDHAAVAGRVEIFHGTIGDNIHLNRPQIQAADIREALEKVGLLDEILQFPDGLNTKLLTDGAPLSSSQAERLILARAIVGRPRLLLVDGTLDGLADHQMGSTLANLTATDAPWTLVIATGRKEVIAACDRAISLDSKDSEQWRKQIQNEDLGKV